jgi:hypothetical protein
MGVIQDFHRTILIVSYYFLAIQLLLPSLLLTGVTTGWPALEGCMPPLIDVQFMTLIFTTGDPATGFGTPDFNALSTAAGL